MRTLATLSLTITTLSGCFYFGPQPVPMLVDPQNPEIITELVNKKTGEVTVTKKSTKRLKVDNSEPASFADYKEWRKENDPGGQVYAEFKQWEAALKERQLRQQNKAK